MTLYVTLDTNVNELLYHLSCPWDVLDPPLWSLQLWSFSILVWNSAWLLICQKTLEL